MKTSPMIPISPGHLSDSESIDPVAYERDGDKPEDWRTARLPNGQVSPIQYSLVDYPSSSDME